MHYECQLSEILKIVVFSWHSYFGIFLQHVEDKKDGGFQIVTRKQLNKEKVNEDIYQISRRIILFVMKQESFFAVIIEKNA